MTTHISLNNQTFWTPPLSQPAQLRRVHPPRPLATQSRANTPPVSGQNALLTNDWMVISSDEDSDVTESDDDKTDAEDHLPSIAEIVSGLEKEERSRSNAAVSVAAAVPVATDVPSVETRRSSIIIQRHPSPVGQQALLSPDANAAARAPTPAPISPMAMASGEDEQSNHGRGARFCESRRSSTSHENAPQPLFQIEQDTAPDTNPDVVPGPNHHENDPEQPEPQAELHADSAKDATADVTNSTPHPAEVTAQNGCEDVEADTPVDPTAAVPEEAQTSSIHIPKPRQAKRRRRPVPSHRPTAISNEEVHISKRQRMAGPTGPGCGRRSDTRLASELSTHSSKRKTDRGRSGTYLDRKQATAHADASYQEWSLPDAVLQQTRVNGQTTIQLRFAWATSCALHVAPTIGLAEQPSVQSSIRRDSSAETWSRETESTSRGAERLGFGNTYDESDVYDVKRVLARWKRGTYFLEWADGSTGWEPKRNILHQQTIDDFEATYQGLNEGIDVLASRARKGKQQWRVHWHGRPAREDCWVDGKLMDPTRLDKVREFGFDKPRA
jgi:hypothetical protein